MAFGMRGRSLNVCTATSRRAVIRSGKTSAVSGPADLGMTTFQRGSNLSGRAGAAQPPIGCAGPWMWAIPKDAKFSKAVATMGCSQPKAFSKVTTTRW